MYGIALTRTEQTFLKLGLSTDGGYSGKLSCYLVDGESSTVMTTNGYSIHVVPLIGKTVETGYYIWSKETNELLRLDDSKFGGPNLIANTLKVRNQYFDAMEDVQPLDILSFEVGNPRIGLNLDQTLTRRAGVGFRKGLYKGVMHSICVGTNFAPLEWNDDGSNETRMVGFDDYIVLDLKLLIGVIKHLGTSKMLWRDKSTPAIFGNKVSWHCVVMPMIMGLNNGRG